jgi:hypothetical protein
MNSARSPYRRFRNLEISNPTSAKPAIFFQLALGPRKVEAPHLCAALEADALEGITNSAVQRESVYEFARTI